MQTEISAIEAAVQIYFDGLYEGDAAKLATVFNPAASLFMEKDGQLVALPVPEWLERVANRASPISRKDVRRDKILLIDVIGDVNALVKVSCMFAPHTYNDHLSMIKFDGRWQIVAKSYCTV